MAFEQIGFTGLGYAVGGGVRTNQDPIFNWLREHNVANKGLFTGYKDRAVLEKGETVEGLMVTAAKQALKQAKLDVCDVDLIVGYSSISEYLTPNALSKVHQQLGLPDTCSIMPVQSDYTNYLVGIRVANALIKTGGATNALVVCGSNWTQHVDYHQAPSISVGDGACAAVIGQTAANSQFSLLDSATRCATEWYGAMYVSPREMVSPDVPSSESPFVRLGAYSKAVFNLDPLQGKKAFEQFGLKAPPELALSLLKRNKIKPNQVTVISHQASGVLLDAWRTAINPKQYLDTMAEYGNLTLASMGVTFAKKYDEIDTEYLVLLGIGIQQETSALLFNRSK